MDRSSIMDFRPGSGPAGGGDRATWTMLRFKVFENGAAAKSIDLDSAFLVGSESVPVRGQIRFANGQVYCEPRARGAVALSLMWPIKGFGRIMLETTRLQERDEPYNLHVE